ncbi:hypothetical protein KSP40_PGU010044 [Platanthera guangdongensis]|uniref:Uncharacterized protein n=1 Tax=Platanthera guangdongensis TaxID=2320717 RepID=A0ABR2M3M7_9ASPA
METNEEGIVEGFLGAILPPRLENAGLEDCALPLESIMEAFSLAAASLKSRVAASFSVSADGALNGEGDGCVQDPGPSNGQIPDKLLGAGEISSPVQPLCVGSGNEWECEAGNDDVVVFGENMVADRVLIVGATEGEADGSEYVFGGDRGCAVAGEILPGEKNGYGHRGDDLNEDDEIVDGPILIEV